MCVCKTRYLELSIVLDIYVLVLLCCSFCVYLCVRKNKEEIGAEHIS